MSSRLIGRRSAPRADLDQGFTLIEIIVVIALLAIVMGGVSIAFSAIAATNLRDSASKLAGALRHAWDRSAMTGRVVRMAFDLDKGTYWLEIEPEQSASSSQRFLMAREKEREQQVPVDGGTVSHLGHSRKPDSIMDGPSLLGPNSAGIDTSKLKEGSAQATAAALQSFLGIGAQPPPPPIVFSKLKQTKDGEIKLPKKIAFDWVYSPHQRHRYDRGMAYVYFYPQGLAEKGVVQLSDAAGRRYWLWVHPLTGKVRVESGEAQLDLADFEKRDDEGISKEVAPQ